jgi:acetoin utilization deacetylase AcuC-like enzyme
MSTAFFSHSICIQHEPGPGHPESPDRLKSVYARLETEPFGGLIRMSADAVEPDIIKCMHSSRYVETLLAAVPDEGYRALDPDTFLSPASGEAALRSTGGVCQAVDLVVSGDVANAFCALRPPGHHAEHDRAMGFCLFNNVAIGAKQAQIKHGLDRVAVIDFDVHHGNGTQHMFEQDPSLFYGSSHQFPAYPGTGAASETGVGNICNVPLAPGAGSIEFRNAYTDIILPALRVFEPDLLLISAGFDAHISDPLCQLNVETEDFAWITRELLEVADECCEGRAISTLEGGYDLQALADSVAAHVSTMVEAA